MMTRGISHSKSAMYVGVVWGTIIGSILTCIAWPSWITLAIAILLIGSRQNALLVVMHECWHYSLVRNKRFNDIIGSVLVGWPVGAAYLTGRARHLAHHRLLGSARDPDYKLHCSYDKKPGKPARKYFFDLVSGGQFRRLLGLRKEHGAANATISPTALRRWHKLFWLDASGIIMMQGIIWFTFSIYSYWWLYLAVWLLPLITVATFANGVRAFVEHYSFDGDQVSPDERLFTIEANWAERAFFSPMNFNHHAEHHLYPHVSAFQLPALRQPLVEQKKIRIRRGYLATMVSVLLPGSQISTKQLLNLYRLHPIQP